MSLHPSRAAVIARARARSSERVTKRSRRRLVRLGHSILVACFRSICTSTEASLSHRRSGRVSRLRRRVRRGIAFYNFRGSRLSSDLYQFTSNLDACLITLSHPLRAHARSKRDCGRTRIRWSEIPKTLGASLSSSNFLKLDLEGREAAKRQPIPSRRRSREFRENGR